MSTVDEIIQDIQTKWPAIQPEKLQALREIIEARLDPKPGKRVPKRNILLDAIVEACGGNPRNTTAMAFRTAATALADIKSVEPDLQPEELFKRARRYKNKFTGAALTPMALCKYWGELSEQPVRTFTTAESTRIQNTPPEGWWDWLCANMPDDEHPAWGQLTVARNMRNYAYLPESWKNKCRASLGHTQSIGELVQ